ncbi:hypothetical protein AgCh_015554 [Apium graveolens]
MATIRYILAVAASSDWFVHQLDVNNAFLHGDLSEEVYMKVPDGVPNPFSKGTDHEAISELKVFLHQTFGIKDLGRLNYFLCIEVSYLSTGIFLSQKKFTHELLDNSALDLTKKATTPLPLNMKLSAGEGDSLSNSDDYRSLDGKLNFLTTTHPDLAYTVQSLSQFMHSPCTTHFAALTHTLRYVAHTVGQGYVLLLGNSPVSWKSKKQSTISKSSSEDEYRATTTASSEVTWLIRLLVELGVSGLTPVTLHFDNQSALHIAKNPVFHERTKHFEIDCHFTRDKVMKGLIQLTYLPTHCQLADVFTKILPSLYFKELLSKLGFHDPQSPTIPNLRGGVGPIRSAITLATSSLLVFRLIKEREKNIEK